MPQNKGKHRTHEYTLPMHTEPKLINFHQRATPSLTIRIK